MQERRSGADRRSVGRRKSDIEGYQAYSTQAGGQQHSELIQKHLKLVSLIVSRLAIGLPAWIDKRDLISAGVIGLIDAAKHYNPTKGVKFETYASTRIRGAVFDELRSMDWIPRSVRDKAKHLEQAIGGLTEKLGRFPTDAEVADSLGWSMEKYHTAIEEVSGTTLLSLDEVIQTSPGGGTVTRIESVRHEDDGALKTMEKQELLDRLVKVIGGLGEQERLVIALYYYEELTLKEIGMVLKVSESRVSQIHTAAILKIRSRLTTLFD